MRSSSPISLTIAVYLIVSTVVKLFADWLEESFGSNTRNVVLISVLFVVVLFYFREEIRDYVKNLRKKGRRDA